MPRGMGRAFFLPGRIRRAKEAQLDKDTRLQKEGCLLEISFLLWIQENLRSPFLDWLFPLITFLGNRGIVWLGIGALLLIPPQYRRWGYAFLASLAVTALLGEWVLKPLVARPRPFVEHTGMELLIPPPASFSFPSGHSVSSFAAATVLAKCRRGWTFPAFLLAALMAFSRLYLFVHYPTDVLSGASLGILCALLVCWLFRRFGELAPVKPARKKAP